MSIARPDAGGATLTHPKSLEIPLAARTNEVGVFSAVAHGIGRNHDQIEEKVTPTRMNNGSSNALTTVLPHDLRNLDPPLSNHGRTSAIIDTPPTVLSQVHYPWECLSFAHTPTCPTCVQTVAGRPNTTCVRCGLTFCQEGAADCGRILETLSSDSNDFKTGYPDKYYYCYICVHYVKHEQIAY